MARNRQNLNIIYISDRMRETLRPIASCALTAVVAPMGYGKTTAVRWFLAEQAKAGAVVLQASIYSDNRSIFWKSVQKAFAAAGLTVLEGYDCPADASGAALLLEDLCAALGGKTPYYLFLDDFHLLGDERVAQFLCRLAYRLPENVHLIVASRNRFLPGEQVVRLGRRLHRIEADGLRLNREELLAYTHRCGVEITAAQAESLLRSCEGWFSAVYLNLHALAERGSLLQPGPDIYAMFTAAMLESLPEKTRGFLAVMGLADEFTVEMARAVTALPDAEEVLRALTQQNAFVTRLPDGVSFRFHHMMKECAERLFAQLPAARQTEVWQRYGRWYAQKAQYLHALQAFEHCGDRDAALAVIEADAGDLLASLSPAELLQRLDRCPVEALQRHPLAILVLMRRMFTWQQIPKMMELKALLEAAVAQHPEWPAAERGNLLGECDLIQSFLFYNDITQMSRLHRSASRQMSRPAVTLPSARDGDARTAAHLQLARRQQLCRRQIDHIGAVRLQKTPVFQQRLCYLGKGHPQRKGHHILAAEQMEVHHMVGTLQIFDLRIGQRPQAFGGGNGHCRAVLRLGGAGKQGRKLLLVHRQNQILHGIHPESAVGVGRCACRKGQRSPAAPAAQLRSRRKPCRGRYSAQFDEIQVKPFSLGVPAQQRICIWQLLHDARILPPGKIFHALAFQPAAQGRVRAAYRNVKYHLTFSFPPAARLDFCAGLEYDK